jgi:hypothetical protein
MTTLNRMQSIKLNVMPTVPIEIRPLGKKGSVQLVQKLKGGSIHGGNTYNSIEAARQAIEEAVRG